MDLNKILLNLKEVRSLYENCDNCKQLCDIQYKIKLCGHIYCKKCIKSIENCIKCGTKFMPKDVCTNKLDKNDPTINQFKDLQHLLEPESNNPKNAIGSNSLVSIHLDNESIDENDYFNIIDNYSTCDCTYYSQVKEGKPVISNHKKELANKKNAVGETKLFHACKKANEKEVEELLESGASVNVQDYAGWTPLHEAVYGGNLKIAERLLKLGSVVNVPGDMYDTPLHKAIETRNLEMALLLIKYGADVNLRNYEGNSPLKLALPEFKQNLEAAKPEHIVLKMPEYDKNYVFYLLGTKESIVVDAFNKFNQKLIPTTNSNTINSNVTHVISTNKSKLLEMSYELLLAIAHQIPVVTYEWLKTCISVNKIVDYTEYFIIGTNDFNCDVINRSQTNKYKMNPKLFSGCNFYVTNPTVKANYKINDKIITKDDLVKLITAAGGKILKREPHLGSISSIVTTFPWHAKSQSLIETCSYYFVYIPSSDDYRQEIKYNMKELRHVPYTWIFDCILQYQLVTPTFK